MVIIKTFNFNCEVDCLWFVKLWRVKSRTTTLSFKQSCSIDIEMVCFLLWHFYSSWLSFFIYLLSSVSRIFIKGNIWDYGVGVVRDMKNLLFCQQITLFYNCKNITSLNKISTWLEKNFKQKIYNFISNTKIWFY